MIFVLIRKELTPYSSFFYITQISLQQIGLSTDLNSVVGKLGVLDKIAEGYF